jgi:integrase
MRRSSVRLRLWAMDLNPLRLISYGVFLFIQNSIFEPSWHTHGTLDYNKLHSITIPRNSLSLGLKLRFYQSKSYKSLFQRAFSVPQHTIRNNIPREIKDLSFQNVALYMRRCIFFAIFLYFGEFFNKEMNMASIQKRETKDGKDHYRVQIRIKGHPIVRKTFESKTRAKLWAQKTEIEIKDGKYFKTAEARKHTLGEAIARYEKDVLPNKPRAKQGQQLKWWKETLGCYLLSDVSPAVIAECRDKLSQSITKFGQKKAPTTVLRYIAALSHVFTVAMTEWGWVEESPMKKVSKPKIGLLRARFLSDEERERLLSACRESTNSYLYPAVVLALGTGMRRSEIMNLTARDIDLVNGRILLEKTKNGERRLIPLKGHALEVIQNLIQQKHQNIKFLFPSNKGSQPIDLRFPWEQALKKAGISNFKFHDLRHSCASFLLMTGATLMETAELLGHKTLAMVKRYSHMSESHASNVVAKMNEKIFG